MKTETIQGTYGDQFQQCDVIICHDIDDCGGKWYTVAGSKNVNYTLLPLSNGVNVERVIDEEGGFNNQTPITSELELITEVEDLLS